MTRPRALLLDVMGTLVHDPFFEVMPEFFGLSFREMLDAKHPSAWLEFELAQRSEPELLRDFFADGRAFDHEAFLARVTASYQFLPGIEALLEELHAAGVPMYALSNYSVWYHRIESQVALSRFVEWRFVSCDTGVRKPDPRAYLQAVEALELPAQELLFVDDRRSNCEAARALGMDALLYTDTTALRAELVTKGLLAPS